MHGGLKIKLTKDRLMGGKKYIDVSIFNYMDTGASRNRTKNPKKWLDPAVVKYHLDKGL